MVITVEISLYPLKDDFENYILDFIKALRSNSDLKVYTTAMSTLVKGDMNVVFDNLKIELGKIYEVIATASTVLKIVNRPVPIEDGYYEF